MEEQSRWRLSGWWKGNQVFNPCKVFATLLFFFPTPPPHLPCRRGLHSFEFKITHHFFFLVLRGYLRTITCKGQGLALSPRIYFCFLYVQSHLSPFPPLIFYYPLYMLKNLNDIPWFLTSTFLFDSFPPQLRCPLLRCLSSLATPTIMLWKNPEPRPALVFLICFLKSPVT